MIKLIVKELRNHIPFTIFGTILGIIFMLVFQNISYGSSYRLFYIMHPVHIVFSAITTASMFNLYKWSCLKGKFKLWNIVLLTLIGAIGTATLSDSLIPYLAEKLLNMPNSQMHIGFIEEPLLAFPPALFGITLAYFRPSTKFPHFGHVLLSTWASLFHFLMALGGGLSISSCAISSLFLFFAVWFPCCFSDIVFPLLFVKPEEHHKIHCCH